MNDLERIGNNVRRYRKLRNLSQTELAELVDISVPHLSDIENGKSEMGIRIFHAIVKSLNVSADILLDDTAITSSNDAWIEPTLSIMNEYPLNNPTQYIALVTYLGKILELTRK